MALPKGNQSWILTGRTDAESKAPILWPPDAKNWLLGKDPDSGKDWRQEEKGTTEDEMVGWHHWLDGHEFEQALGLGDGQGSLACCSPWSCNESDTTEQLSNWTELIEASYFQPYMQTRTPHTLVGRAQNNHSRHSCSKKGETRGCISTVAKQFCPPVVQMAKFLSRALDSLVDVGCTLWTVISSCNILCFP